MASGARESLSFRRVFFHGKSSAQTGDYRRSTKTFIGVGVNGYYRPQVIDVSHSWYSSAGRVPAIAMSTAFLVRCDAKSSMKSYS